MAMPDPPDRSGAVNALWAVHPSDGTPDGNLTFCRRVVSRLREEDDRWGLNWKRGVIGDPSLDVIAFRYGPTDYDARIVDIIAASDDPSHPAFGPSWTVHSEAEAGVVRWHWPGAEVPPAPSPEPPVADPVADPDAAALDAILDALVAEAEVAEAYHDDLMQRIDRLAARVDTLEARQDRALVGEFKLFGYRVGLRLTPEV